jgi:photosystem II stability/assembly factor-like uncharacterized protein
MDKYRAAVAQALASREGRAREGSGAAPWEPVGPTNVGGRITAVAVHPDRPQRIFVGAAFGGVFRTTDGGGTWAPLMDAGPSLSVGALAIDPADPDRIFVGTGEANASGDSYPGTGIYRSTDGGDSWAWCGLPESRHIARIAIHPQDPDLLFAAVMGALHSKGPDRGLYRSTDGGDTWERVLFLSDSTGCIDVVVDPGNPQRVYAAMWERIRGPDYRRVGGPTSGVWRSTDGGDTWERLGGGLPGPGPTVGRIGLALCAAAPNVLYAIYADDPGYFRGLYKSIDGGDTWYRVNDDVLDDLYASYGWYFGNVRVDPQDPDRVYAMGLDTYRSTDGGNTWSNITYAIHVDEHDWWISPQDSQWMLSANDGGLYRTTNGGMSWMKFDGLPITQFYTVEVDPQDGNRIYGGTQDNGTLRTMTGQSHDWHMILGGDGFHVIVDPTDPQIIYAEYQYGNLYKSTDGGSDFYPATAGIPQSERRNWSTPVVMDPVDPQVLYYGTFKVYRTTNGAAWWTAISPDLSDGPGQGNLYFGTITTIAVAPSGPDVIYAGLDDGNVWVTTDGGGTWNPIAEGLPERWVTRIAVDPGDPLVAYVTLSGYREDSPLPHIYRTTDGGATWSPIHGDLPEAPLNVVLVDPQQATRLFVGSDLGVYVTTDLGQHWTPLGQGLPMVAVLDLVLHEPTRTLVAATHGRSMFRLALGSSDVGEATGAFRLALGRPRPNPFRTRVELTLELLREASVEATVHDARGRRLRRLFSGRLPAGAHRLSWDGRDDGGRRVSAGVYWLRVRAGETSSSRRLVLTP